MKKILVVLLLLMLFMSCTKTMEVTEPSEESKDTVILMLYSGGTMIGKYEVSSWMRWTNDNYITFTTVTGKKYGYVGTFLVEK